MALVTLCLFSFLLVSHGCGFRLRGTVSLPDAFQTMAVESLTSSPALNKVVLQALHAAGVKVDADAPYKILLIKEEFTRRVSAVNADARASEYEVREILVFSLLDQEGVALLQEQQVEVIRNYAYELDQVSGKQREENILRSEMRREAAIKMIRQFQFLTL